MVIIGVVLTFAGSDLLSRYARSREVRTTMKLVYAELEADRTELRETLDWMRWEAHACRVIVDNRHDLSRIPADTMESFVHVGSRIVSYHPSRDAFDVLKNSGLMAAVNDKRFLLTLTQGYAALEQMEENVGVYYGQKLSALNEMTRTLGKAESESYYSGGLYAVWNCILSSPSSADFVRSVPSFFQEEYLAGLLADVDRAIAAIGAGYPSVKKQADD